MPDLLLDVKGLETQFKTPEGIVHAVNGVSFGLKEGETLGVVGESGCGKSVTMLSVMGLVASPPGNIAAGEAFFMGQDLIKMPAEKLRQVRGGQIAMIFQDPMTSLNPVLTIGRQLEEPLMIHVGMTKNQASDRSAELLEYGGNSERQRSFEGLPSSVFRRYAPACDDRHGAFLQPANFNCR